MPDSAEPLSFRFDNLLLDKPAGALLRLRPDGQTTRVPLGSRSFAILCLLVERHSGIVTRQEIMDTVWPGLFVEENNLSVQLSNLRRALDTGRDGGSCIQTLPGRGYRFLPEVTPVVARPPHQAADPGSPALAAIGGTESVANPDPTSPEPTPGPPISATDAAPEAPAPRAVADLGPTASAVDAPRSERPFAAASHPHRQRAAWIAGACVGLALLIGSIVWYTASAPVPPTAPVAASAPFTSPATPVAASAVPTPSPTPATPERPRLSIVVLPFSRLSDGVDDHTVDAITEDLTTAIARWHAAQVTARQTALAYKGKPLNVQRIAEELGVRFAIEGSVRRIGTTLRVSVRLVSAATGAHLWADHFDATPDAGGYNVEDIIRHMALALAFKLLDAESARIAREDPTSSDAADALMRARAALYTRPPHPQTQDQVIAMLERALALDPNVAVGWAGLAEALVSSIDFWTDDPTTPAKIRRAEQAIIRGELLAPEERLVMGGRLPVLRLLGRCAEVPAAARRVSAAHPNLAAPPFVLGLCLMHDSRAAEAIPAFEQSIRVNPRNPGMYTRYRAMGYALLFLERYDEAVAWFQKTLAGHPGDSARNRGSLHAAIAAAQALAADMTAARDSAAEASRLWPTLTVRSYYPIKLFSPVTLAQVARMRDGLRLAGVRDHADEDADPGAPPDNTLHTTYNAPTPTAAPGVRTIRTADLPALIDQRKPLVLDASNPWGPSMPGAIVLPGVGVGGSMSDDVQQRLGRKMHQLTGADRSVPVVALGWNAERFQGRNLAMRLAALGYTEVYWYRGGREAWMAAGLPMAEVAQQDW